MLNKVILSMIVQSEEYHKNNSFISPFENKKENIYNNKDNYRESNKQLKEVNKLYDDSYKKNQWYQKVRKEMEEDKRNVKNIFKSPTQYSTKKNINYSNKKIYDV